MPFFGIGPLYVGLVCGLTAAGVWASDSGLLESGIVPGLKVPMRVAGVLVALAGLFIWLVALLGSRIDDGIRNNRLVTDGIFQKKYCICLGIKNYTYICCINT